MLFWVRIIEMDEESADNVVADGGNFSEDFAADIER